MPGKELEPRRALAVGDTVRLAQPHVDDVTARVAYVFYYGGRVMLNMPLAGQSIWNIDDLVLVTPDKSP